MSALTEMSSPNPQPVVPTGDPRHMTKFREGAISGEVFGKGQLAKIAIDHDVLRERERGNSKYLGEERVEVDAKITKKPAKAKDQKQEAAKVRVGRSSQARHGSRKRGKEAIQKRKGVQANADKSEKKALKRKGGNGRK
jgi:hypothetical protein